MTSACLSSTLLEELKRPKSIRCSLTSVGANVRWMLNGMAGFGGSQPAARHIDKPKGGVRVRGPEKAYARGSRKNGHL